MDASTILIMTLILGFVGLVSAVAISSDFARWFGKKKYRYEVTFALYMLTPTERFLFNSFFFLFFSMVLIAGCLYLPEHIMTISHRAFYYWSGQTSSATSSAPAASATASAASGISQMLAYASQNVMAKSQGLAAAAKSVAANVAAGGSVMDDAAAAAASFHAAGQAPIAGL